MRDIRYFTCVNGAIWSVFPNGESNYHQDIKVTSCGKTVQVLGEFDGEPSETTPRLIEAEHSLWDSLLDLSAHIEAETGGATLEELRSDLEFQLKHPDELDWSYLLNTAARALVRADRDGLNMKFNGEPNIQCRPKTSDFPCHYQAILPPTCA